jgi:hypothetical protein
LAPAGGQGAIDPADVAEAVLLPFRVSANCVPEEVGFQSPGSHLKNPWEFFTRFPLQLCIICGTAPPPPAPTFRADRAEGGSALQRLSRPEQLAKFHIAVFVILSY